MIAHGEMNMDTLREFIKKVTPVLMIATMLTLVQGVAQAREIQFDDRVDAGEHTLTIRGTGVLRYLVVIEAYAGALYTLPGLDTQNVLADTPKRLELRYYHAIKGEDFGPATYKGLEKFLSKEQIDRLRERIDYLNSLYVDVEPGDRYALTYVPGIGTELSLNGEPRGVVEGVDFASALFALWLGDKPFDRRFKSALLGSDG